MEREKERRRGQEAMIGIQLRIRIRKFVITKAEEDYREHEQECRNERRGEGGGGRERT